MREKVVVAWSGGKDSALALYEVLNSSSYQVLELFTMIEKDQNRIKIHNVRRILLEQQAKALRLPLEEIFLLKSVSDAEYEDNLLKILKKHRDNGGSSVVFGDIFLEDIRKYRERVLTKAGLKGIFPLWKKDTQQLAYTFINLGFKALITSVDSYVLGKDLAGREYDEKFLSDLPVNVDQCGENGEFRTFIYNGAIFREKVGFKKGELTLRGNRFYSCDLLPA